MYGMIHCAAEGLIRSTFGDETWSGILNTSGLTADHFHKTDHYGDEVTGALLEAIVAETGLEVEEMLEALGRYWIGFVSQSSYKSIFEVAGSTFEEFVANLDEMHDNISQTMPKASMPSFEVLSVDGPRLTLSYQSDRDGLTPFVRGLLIGLLDHFQESGHVSQSEDADGIVFHIDRNRLEGAA